MILPALLLALAQGADPPVAGQAGEIVGSVRVVAPPADQERLRRYVEIAAGEPFDTQTVRHAVELLYATGEFADVVVESRRGADGLELVFRPVPAPLLDRIEVRGDRVLSAGRLRRIARLRPREPLWPARLDRAARDAALALAEDGYLEARVAGAAEPRGPVADAVFTVTAGRRVRVSRAGVESADPSAPDLLRPLVEPDAGEVFRREEASRAAEKMRRVLVRTGRWRAQVAVREAYDPAAAEIALAFEATPGPPVFVEFAGSRVPGDLRGDATRVVQEGGAGADSLEDASERLENALRRLGHREPLVTRREEARPGRLVIVFDVRTGPVARVASVSVVGSPRELGPLLETAAAGPLRDQVLEEDAGRLTRALEADGYADARVEAEVAEGGGDLPVVFRVRAGPRTMVSAFRIESPVPVPSEGGARELRVREGRPYAVRDLALDRNALLAAYRNAGYLQVEVTPEAVLSEDRTGAAVTLRVSPGPRTEVDHVVIAGLQETAETVVRRELLVDEGEPLGLQAVLETQRRLAALGIFQRVSVAEMDPDSAERRSLVVATEEAPRTTVAYGIGFAERDRFRGSVEVSRRNIFGMDRSLSLFARYSLRGNRVLVSYREPFLFGRRQEMFLSVYREEEDRDAFDFVRRGTLLQVARRLAEDWSLIARYTFQETDVFELEVPLDEVDRQFRNSTFAGPSTSIVNDTRDDPLDPRRGRFLGADLALSHDALGGDSFMRSFFQASWYRRLQPRLVLALNARLGLSRTFGSAPPRLPLPDRFFAGGDYSLRGFRVDTAGPLEPSVSGELVPTGGNALLTGGAELRFDAGRVLSLAAFSDLGNVYPLVSDMDLGDLRYTAGIGVRYKSAFGPLRLDWGYKLNRRAGESPSHLHFTIGHAF